MTDTSEFATGYCWTNTEDKYKNLLVVYFEYKYQGRVFEHGVAMAQATMDAHNYCFDDMFCFQLGWKEGLMIKLLENKEDE